MQTEDSWRSEIASGTKATIPWNPRRTSHDIESRKQGITRITGYKRTERKCREKRILVEVRNKEAVERRGDERWEIWEWEIRKWIGKSERNKIEESRACARYKKIRKARMPRYIKEERKTSGKIKGGSEMVMWKRREGEYVLDEWGVAKM